MGIKVLGPNLDQLEKIGKELENAVKDVPGTRSAYAERVTTGYFLDFTINRKEIARYGLTVDDMQEIVQTAVGGMNLTTTVEGRERYSVNVRYARELAVRSPGRSGARIHPFHDHRRHTPHFVANISLTHKSIAAYSSSAKSNILSTG